MFATGEQNRGQMYVTEGLRKNVKKNLQRFGEIKFFLRGKPVQILSPVCYNDGML